MSYADNAARENRSLGSANVIVVTGPTASRPATFVAQPGYDAAAVTSNLQRRPPGGIEVRPQRRTTTVTLQANQVTDTSGDPGRQDAGHVFGERREEQPRRRPL